MGQGDIIELLEKEKEPLGRREIAEKLGLSLQRVSGALKRLEERGVIEIKEISFKEAQKRYNTKNYRRRMRLYYVEDS